MRKTEVFEVQSDAKLAFNAGLASILPIGNLGFWLGGLRLDFEIAKTDGSSPTPYQDWLARVATGIVLSGGNRTYVSHKTRDLRTLYWQNRCRLAGAERMPDFETGAQTFYWSMTLLFDPDPLRYDDQLQLWTPRVGIPPDGNLQLELDWAANSALGSNITTAAATLCRVAYLGFYPGTSLPKWQPNWQSTIYSPQQPWSGLQGSFDVPPGSYVRRTTLVFTNGAQPSDVRTDGTSGNAISEFGIGGISAAEAYKLKVRQLSRQSQASFEVADDNSGVPGATAAYAAATTKVQVNPGVGYVDWAQFVDSDPNTSGTAGNDPVFGLNMVESTDGQPKAEGAAELLFTVDANTNTNVLIALEGYKKYPWA